MRAQDDRACPPESSRGVAPPCEGSECVPCDDFLTVSRRARRATSVRGRRCRGVDGSDAAFHHRATGALQRDTECISKTPLRGHVTEIDAEVNDGLRDLWANATDDAFSAHEPRGSNGLEDVLRS